MSYGGGHYEREVKLDDYITQKISMLEDEFYIRLSFTEISHMRALKTEGDVDRYAHQILIDRL